MQILSPVAVATTSTLLFDTAGREVTAMIQNLGPNKLTLLNANGVLGPEIAAGATLMLDDFNGKLYAKAATALQVAPADTRIMLVQEPC